MRAMITISPYLFIVALTLSCAVTQFFRSFLPVLNVPLSQDLGLIGSDLAFISSAWFMAFALAQIPAGFLLDRIGAGRTVTLSMGSLAFSCALFSAANSFTSLCLAAALMGAFCAPVFTGTLVFIGTRVTQERFSFLSGIVLAVSTLGAIGAGTPLVHAVSAGGWRVAIVAVGVIAFALSATMFVLGWGKSPAGPDSSNQTEARPGFREAVLNYRFLSLLAFSFVSSAPAAALRSLWVGPYLSDIFGMNEAACGHVVSVLVLAVTVASIGYAWAANRLDLRIEVIILGSVITVLLLGALAIYPSASETAAVMMLSAVCLFGSTYGLMMVEAKSRLPLSYTGRGVTLVNLVSFLGVSIAQSLGGAAVHWLSAAGVSSTMQFSILFAGLGGALLCGTFALVFERIMHTGRQVTRTISK